MNRVLSDILWIFIQEQAKSARIKRAAIAYVTDDQQVSFGNGDTLIVDASDRAIESGQTSASTLRLAHNKGARLFSITGLHAKVMILDNIAVVGSANVSKSSVNGLIEAAVVSDQPEIISSAEQFIVQLEKQAEEVNDDFLKHIEGLEVNSGFPQTRAGVTINIDKYRAWIVGVAGDCTYPGDEKPVTKVMQQVKSRVKKQSVHVDWFWWPSNGCQFYERAKEGDSVIRSIVQRKRIRQGRG